ncbi:hypothetical protein MMC26_004677 [Xylographa opegraphella]|nr:hypothetical protein [Xylographa opegraphella]
MSQPWDYIAKLVCIGDSGTGKSSLTIRLCEGRFSPHHDVTIGVEFGSRIVPVGPPASLSLSINNPSSQQPSSSPPTSPQKSPSPSISSKKATSASKPTPAAPTQKRMKLSLWDTAGQETYKSITRSYFRGASGALLVFDISRRATFESVTEWLHDLRQIAEEGIVVILVGNKSDLASDSLVSSSGGETNPGSGRPTQNKRAVSHEEATTWCRENNVMQYVETSAKSGEGVERAFLEVAERIYQNIEAGRYDLNDRRSGVKGPGAGGGARAGKAGAGGAVVLGMNEVGGMGTGAGKGWGGGCC